MAQERTQLSVPVDRAALALASLAAAGIHFAVMSDHFSEYVVFGIFFAVVAWLQALWAVGVVIASTRPLLLTGAAGNAVIVLVWVVSRTTGLPIGPEAGTPEPATFVDVLATILGLLIVAGSLIVLLRRRPVEFARGRAGAIVVISLTVALALLTTAAIAGASQGEEVGHGGDPHEEAASVAQG